jgi:AAA+ superfamily predicted ATPase
VNTARELDTAAEPGWLRAVRLRCLRRVLWCRALWARHHYEQEQSLAITHSEVERTLVPLPDVLHAELRFYGADEQARAMTEEIDALADGAADPRWTRLASELELSPAESALLAAALAAELVPALRRVYGYLQDEVTALDASPSLAGQLWNMPPPRLGAESGLVRWRLARPLELGREQWSSLAGWVADPAVLGYLLNDDRRGATNLVGVAVHAPSGPQLYGRECNDIVALIGGLAGRMPIEIELTAPGGAGKTALAARVADRLGRPLVAVDARAIAALADPATTAVRELRRARLEGSLLLWRHAELLPAAALDAVHGREPVTLLAAETPLPVTDPGRVLRRSYALAPLDRAQRVRVWEAVGEGPPPGPVTDWALRPAEIVTVAAATAGGPGAVRELCARLLLDTPSELLERLPLPYTWDDLVVAAPLLAHLREFEAQARSRSEVLDGWGLSRLAPLGRGATALFAGPSGTGKTMAAQVLARELGLELHRVDLAGVVNKYIGETEKHLRAVFAACERAPVMLFFDEADALFGRRMQVNDAHDRFANIEVDYLLQRMEQFDGIAVLATNRKGDIDTAFLRRLRFVIDFVPPTVAERERLWRLALESSQDETGRPLIDALDWRQLAVKLDLTGAGIKASALAAAFLARTDGTRIGTHHVIAAARRELEKQGVVVRTAQLQRAGQLMRPEPLGNGDTELLSAVDVDRMAHKGASG